MLLSKKIYYVWQLLWEILFLEMLLYIPHKLLKPFPNSINYIYDSTFLSRMKSIVDKKMENID